MMFTETFQRAEDEIDKEDSVENVQRHKTRQNSYTHAFRFRFDKKYLALRRETQTRRVVDEVVSYRFRAQRYRDVRRQDRCQ
jgi:hypothetical protein